MEPLVIILALAVIAALSAVQRHQRRSQGASKATRRPPGRRPQDRRPQDRRPQDRTPQGSRRAGSYAGDFTGRVDVRYSPSPNGRPDPGEIVWTWVPFEEDHSRGKDRPVLLIGREGATLLGIQLSSRDHYLDEEQEARYGRRWHGIGSGPWDAKRRPSAVRLDRIVRVDPAAVRREGAVLDRRTFDEVSRSLSELHHW